MNGSSLAADDGHQTTAIPCRSPTTAASPAELLNMLESPAVQQTQAPSDRGLSATPQPKPRDSAYLGVFWETAVLDDLLGEDGRPQQLEKRVPARVAELEFAFVVVDRLDAHAHHKPSGARRPSC